MVRFFMNGTYIPAPNGGLYDHRFKVLNKIIESAEVYLCTDEKDGSEVVVKAELIGSKLKPSLEKENAFYKKLSKSKDFNNVLWYYRGMDHRILILKKRGIDLRKFYKEQNKVGKWEANHLNKYAVQMIRSLEKCHSHGILHLDPKPNNFVLDKTDDKIYLIDFDCSKLFLDANGQHIPYREDVPLNQIRGNWFYLSLNGHNCKEQSRRDDMLFLGYSLIWMARNGLPWCTDAIYTDRNQKNEILKEEKSNYSFEELCRNTDKKKLDHLVQYMTYCTELKFEERPNYSYLVSLFTSEE